MSDIDFAHILLVQILLGRHFKPCLRHLTNLQECLRSGPLWQFQEVGHWYELLVLEGITETQERARTALKGLREHGYLR